MSNFLCYDFGATSGRAMMVSFNGEKMELNELHRFSNDPVEINGVLYWDVFRLFHEIKVGLVKAKAAYKEIDSIGIDTWGVDFALLDKRGNMSQLPVHYRDKRTDGAMEKVFKIIDKDKIYAKTGIQFMQFNTIFQLFALKEQNPSALDNAENMLFVPDLFGYFLTGEKVTERTIASTSGLYNPSIKDWDYEIIDKLGFNRKLFGKIVDSGSVLGVLSTALQEELGLSAIPVISVCGHDTASAVAAVPSQEDCPAYISCGTWSLLGAELKEPNFSTLNFTNEIGFNGSVRYLRNIMGLWIINECKRNWETKGIKISYGEIMTEAKNAECVGLIDVDAKDFMFPVGMDEKVAAYLENHGCRRPKTIGETARCIYESLATSYQRELAALEKTLNKKFSALHIIGGGGNASLLMELTAKKIGIPVLVGPTEATILGNAAVQAIATNKIANLLAARKVIANSTNIIEY